MRADRLIAILLLLQRDGLLKAADLAVELEVSERTIYRDVEALGMAGVPVYTQSGPGGGISLLESYRTDLTGFTTAELQALLALSVPAPLMDLGIGSDLQSALRKLAASAAGSRIDAGAHIQERVYIDQDAWQSAGSPGSRFEIVRRALWENQRLALTYTSQLGSRAGSINIVVNPLGLVASSGDWILVGAGDEYIVTVPLRRLQKAQPLAETFARPPDFDLETFWQSRKTLLQNQQPSFFVEAHIVASALPQVGEFLLDPLEDTYVSNWHRVRLQYLSFEEARMHLLSLGGAAEVLNPLSLRLSIIDHARQIREKYKDR